MSVDEFSVLDDRDWLSGIPSSSRKRIEELQKAHSEVEDVARLWLSEIGSPTVAPMGAANAGQEFFRAFKSEFWAFVCGGRRYAEERQKLAKLQGPTEKLIIGSISIALSPWVGAAAALLGPAVAVMLIGMSKMSRNAWCEANKPVEPTSPTAPIA